MENELSFEDFLKLTDKEKGEAYKKLSDEDKFKARLSQPMSGEVIGYEEYTEDERQENKKILRDHLKKIGVIKD